VLLCLEEVEVESLTFSWLKIRPGFIWPWVGNIPSNGHLEKRSPKGRLPHENFVLQLSWVDKPVKKIVLKEIGGFNFSEGYFAIRNLRGSVNQWCQYLNPCFLDWDFATVDAKGCSGGLATGWLLKKCNYEIVWGFESGIGLNFFSTYLGHSMTIC
jgi:hypothetical protein